MTAAGGCLGVGRQHVRGAVGGDDADLVGDLEIAQDVRRLAHDGQVAVAAHDDADDRLLLLDHRGSSPGTGSGATSCRATIRPWTSP
jgi:hypothetical protein